MRSTKIKIHSTYPPAVFVDRRGVRRIAAGLIVSLDDTPVTQEGVNICLADWVRPEHFEWTPLEPTSRTRSQPVHGTVSSARGGFSYTVTTFPDGRKTCTCPGFTFRRHCKHVAR